MGASSTSSRGLHVHGVICTSALFCSSRLSTNWDLLSRASGITFCYFVPFRGPTSPSLSVSRGLFFFRSGLGFRPRSVGICGGGGGRLEGTWDLGAAFDIDSLPLEAKSSLKLLLPLFNAILSSSSSEELSGWAMCEHQNSCLIYPQRPRWLLEEPSDCFPPQN